MVPYILRELVPHPLSPSLYSSIPCSIHTAFLLFLKHSQAHMHKAVVLAVPTTWNPLLPPVPIASWFTPSPPPSLCSNIPIWHLLLNKMEQLRLDLLSHLKQWIKKRKGIWNVSSQDTEYQVVKDGDPSEMGSKVSLMIAPVCHLGGVSSTGRGNSDGAQKTPWVKEVQEDQGEQSLQDRISGMRELHTERIPEICRKFLWSMRLSTAWHFCVTKLWGKIR